MSTGNDLFDTENHHVTVNEVHSAISDDLAVDNKSLFDTKNHPVTVDDVHSAMSDVLAVENNCLFDTENQHVKVSDVPSAISSVLAVDNNSFFDTNNHSVTVDDVDSAMSDVLAVDNNSLFDTDNHPVAESNIYAAINAVSKVASDIKSSANESTLRYENKNYETWKNAKEKENNHFSNSVFKACYIGDLYGRRVSCFYKLLKSFETNVAVINFIKTCENVTSFGCGAAPEVLAYIKFVRCRLRCSRLNLKCFGYDSLGDWDIYIDALKQHLDNRITFEFRNIYVDKNSVANMSQSGVCLMSYSHWAEFPDIWALLKRNFNLIIILDVCNQKFRNAMRHNGYKYERFSDSSWLDNPMKRFFYFLKS